VLLILATFFNRTSQVAAAMCMAMYINACSYHKSANVLHRYKKQQAFIPPRHPGSLQLQGNMSFGKTLRIGLEPGLGHCHPA
jgi:hypothetical protein